MPAWNVSFHAEGVVRVDQLRLQLQQPPEAIESGIAFLVKARPLVTWDRKNELFSGFLKNKILLPTLMIRS